MQMVFRQPALPRRAARCPNPTRPMSRGRTGVCRSNQSQAGKLTLYAESGVGCSRREVGLSASKTGKPIKRYASGKFLRLGFEPDLRPVPGTGEETPGSAPRRYIRRERYDYPVDFFGRFWRSVNLGCCAQARTRPSRRGVTESRGVCGSLYSRQRSPRRALTDMI